ncbi:unnamed protein product [Pieris macdunnoughi]|uniref:Cuticle protein n=1 Tax=Pieris macdunnoughi TaxID=345717 RepID=A0A821V3H9_9NEOP|nr:unnamed protein product [Pieris macdunnoughi]
MTRLLLILFAVLAVTVAEPAPGYLAHSAVYPVIHHAPLYHAPIVHHAPIYHQAPVYHHAPIYHAPIVHHSPIIAHPPVVKYKVKSHYHLFGK